MIAATLKLELSWLDPYIAFLCDRSLPNNVKEAEKMQRTVACFWLSEDRRLYRQSFGGPYLPCLYPNKNAKLLIGFHEGIYGEHLGGRSLAHQVMTQGFWWPNME